LKKILITLFIVCTTTIISFAQEPVKINNGDHSLTFNGVFSTYMNWRDYPSGTVGKLEKNTFKLKDARFGLEGKIGDEYEYKLQLDFGGFTTSVIDPSAPPLYDANFTYKGFKKFANITVGYGKVPYALSSLIEHEWSPYWSRADISKGDCFSRRDLGVKLTRSFWKDRVKAFAGIYTGVGEAVLAGTNDPSGAYEYIGRMEFSYPDKMPKEYADTKVRTTPNFAIGINTRYANKKLPAGTSFLAGEVGALLSDTSLNFKVVNGEKWVYGADFSVEYMGFSAQFEGHTIKGILQNANDPLLTGLPKNLTNGYFKAGGWFAQANYFAKPIKTIFSIRYDELNANDLVSGLTKHLAASICYRLSGYHSMIRAEFFRNLSQTESINISKWENQWRVGWQLQIE
jgi:hypothetical protein